MDKEVHIEMDLDYTLICREAWWGLCPWGCEDSGSRISGLDFGLRAWVLQFGIWSYRFIL